MPTYDYQALKTGGGESHGTLQADSERHARQMLRDMGLVPLEIRPAQAADASRQGLRIPAGELALITRQLAAMLAAGLPLVEALGAVAQQAQGRSHRLLLDIQAQVREGQSLADALARHPASFDPLYLSSVAAGEQSGQLDTIFLRLAEQIERQQRFRQQTLLALIYPALLSLVALAVVAGLMVFVVPRILTVFDRAGQSLPPATLLLMQWSDFARDWGGWLLLALLLAGVAFWLSLRLPGWRLTVHAALLRLPLLGPWLKQAQATRFAHAMGLLLAAAVPVTEALRTAASGIGNLAWKAGLQRAGRKVEEGLPLHQALGEEQLMPPVMLRLIASGESSGELDTLFSHAARLSEEAVERASQAFLALLAPALVLLVGGMVLFIVLAILVPIFNMNQLLS